MREEVGYGERASERAAEWAMQIILSPAVSALKGYVAPAEAGGWGQTEGIRA